MLHATYCDCHCHCHCHCYCKLAVLPLPHHCYYSGVCFFNPSASLCPRNPWCPERSTPCSPFPLKSTPTARTWSRSRMSNAYGENGVKVKDVQCRRGQDAQPSQCPCKYRFSIVERRTVCDSYKKRQNKKRQNLSAESPRVAAKRPAHHRRALVGLPE